VATLRSDGFSKTGGGFVSPLGGFGKRQWTGEGFVGEGGGGPPPDPEETAPSEFVNALQFTAMLGFGIPAMWKNAWLYNEDNATGPYYPLWGMSTLVVTTGTPAVVEGPTDQYDKGIQFTDAQACSLDSASGAVPIQGAHWALFRVMRVDALPAAIRNLVGHNSTEDVVAQLMTTGQIRLSVTDSVAGTITTDPVGHPAVINHLGAGWFALGACGLNGQNMIIATDLGASPPRDISGVTALATTATWRVGQNAACAPVSQSFDVVGYSDGSTEQNAAFVALYNNLPAAVANLSAALGL
jgi:hypothetical protein